MKRLLASLALGPLMFAPIAQADTLEEALTAAYQNNPNMEDARLGVRSAREERVQARAAYLPNVGLSGSYGTSHVESDTVGIFGPSSSEADLEPSNITAQVTQQVFTGGRRVGQSRLARANVEGAQHALRGTEQDVLLAAVQAFLSVRRDADIVRLSEAHVDGLTRQVSGTQHRLQVGEVSRTDLAQAQSRLAGARAALARARAELEASRGRYEAIVGHAPEDLAPVGASPETPYSLESAIEKAERTHPDLLRSRSAEEAARARVTIERAALLPQVSIVGRADESEDLTISEPRRETQSAVAQVQVPLFEGGFAWSRTAQGRINVRRAQAGTEARRRDVVANVVEAWSNLTAGREVVMAAREQVQSAEAAVEGTDRERGLGLRTTLDVLDAQEEARNARIGLARAEADAIFASYALLAATGQLTLNNLAGAE